MKTIVIFLLVSVAFNSFAQEDEINIKRDDNQLLGYYFSFSTKLSKLHNEYITYSGMQFGLVKNHKYAIGLAGYGLSGENTFNYFDNLSNIHQFENEITYGGLFIEYSLLNELPIHISTPLLIGGGKINVKESIQTLYNKSGYNHIWESDYWAIVEDSKFVVFEPGMSLEVNLVKWMSLGVGVSYRYIVGNNLSTLPNADNDLSGISFETTLKIGSF